MRSGGGSAALDLTPRWKAVEEVKGLTRSVDFVFTLGTVLLDYKWSFRNVDEGTAEYERVYHTVNLRCAERTLRLCKRLGGYYIKFGQMVSTLDQGVPQEWVQTLSQCQVRASLHAHHMQDKATPVPFSTISRVLTEDLGMRADEVFQTIDEYPIGAASLAQVHRAVLRSGEEVAVKIQYPSIRRFTLIDMRDCDVFLLCLLLNVVGDARDQAPVPYVRVHSVFAQRGVRRSGSFRGLSRTCCRRSIFRSKRTTRECVASFSRETSRFTFRKCSIRCVRSECV